MDSFQKVFRKWYWIASGFLRKYALGIVLGGVVGILAFSNYGRVLTLLHIKPVSRIGRVGAITLNQLPLDIQQKISSGLTSVDATGDVTLDVAQSITVSEDGKTYTVAIDPNAYWSSGERLSSKDIDLPLPDVTIERPSDESIRFTLLESFAPFEKLLSQPLLKRQQVGFWIKRQQIVGLQQYYISKISTSGQFISELQLESDNEIIRYYFYPTEQEAVTAYKLGKVDSLEHMSQPYLSDWPRTMIDEADSQNRYLALFFNTADPQLQDKSVRQMLAYATPKKSDEDRVISPIDSMSFAYNPQVKPYDYNVKTAQEVYDKLVAANPNLKLAFELMTTPEHTELAEQITEAWRSIGIDATLKIVSFPDPSDYQVLLIGEQTPLDPDQYGLWHSTQATNITRYQNPKIDKLLEDGRRERDQEVRKEIYQEFQRFLLEDSPAVFLHRIHTYTIQRGMTS